MSKMKVYQEKVEAQQTSVNLALNTEPHEGEQVKEIAKDAGSGSIGWAEGMASKVPQDSIGWAEGMAAEAPEEDSIGWAEGMADEAPEVSKGWVEGY